MANGRIRVRGSGPLPRNGFTVDRSVFTHTSHHSRDGDIINNDSAQKILGHRRTMMPTMPSWAAALVELMGHYEECCAKMCINIVVESRSILHVSWAALWLRSDGDYYYLYHCPLSTLLPPCNLTHNKYDTDSGDSAAFGHIFWMSNVLLVFQTWRFCTVYML